MPIKTKNKQIVKMEQNVETGWKVHTEKLQHAKKAKITKQKYKGTKKFQIITPKSKRWRTNCHSLKRGIDLKKRLQLINCSSCLETM